MNPSSPNPTTTTTPAPMGRKKSSTARKLLQAAGLAALLVPLGAIAAEATTITYSAGANQYGFAVFNTGSNAYAFELTFDQVDVGGDLDVTTTESPIATVPPGYRCVPIMGGVNCVVFHAVPQSPLAWTGNFHVFISWAFDTNSTYPNSPGDRIRLLHDRSTDELGYIDITDEGSYCSECVPPPPQCVECFPVLPIPDDAGIGGTDDNFSDFVVAQTVPEPSTLLLLGCGVTALLYRRRLRPGRAPRP